MAPDPLITARAELPKRQNSDRFIGYLEISGSYNLESCNAGLTWYQEGKYAQCCPATLQSCYAATACVGGSLIYPYPDKSTTRTIACTDNYDNTAYSICNTALIFENFSDSNPKTDIVCGDSSQNWSYYRKVPASATASIGTNPVSIPQPASTIVVGPDGQVIKTSSSSHKSKAWIAGAVIGPLIGLALVGAIIFLLLSRRKKAKTAPQSGGAAMVQNDPSQPPVGVGGYTDNKPQYQPPPQQYGQPDPYANQTAYNAQQGYAAAPVSPAPEYATPVGYQQPGSPPPQQAYQSDVKYGYAGAPAGGAAELGGDSNASAAAPAPVAHQPSPAPAAAEMSGEPTQHAGPGVTDAHAKPATHT